MLSLSTPMAEYLKSIFLPTFRVFEWGTEETHLTSWLTTHAQSVGKANMMLDAIYDFIHIASDPSPDATRIQLSTEHVRPYGWLLLTLPLNQSTWERAERYLCNWTCVFIAPMWDNNWATDLLLRKPGQYTFAQEGRA